MISIIGETADYNYGFFDISLKSTKPNLVNTSVAFSASTLNFALEEMLDEEYYSAFSLLENLLDQVFVDQIYGQRSMKAGSLGLDDIEITISVFSRPDVSL